MKEGKTVYFLGAGASRASEFELPTMKGFFREDDFKSNDYPNLHRFIKEKFPHVQFEGLNLEEVITSLELSMDIFGSFGEHPEVYIYEARREFDRYVNKRLHIDECKSCSLHKKIFDENVAGETSLDSIITLNYDLVIDNSLYEKSPRSNGGKYLKHECLLGRMYSLLGKTLLMSGERPSLYHSHKSLGFYLKLHGSIDWLYCTNVTCGNHQLFFPNPIGSSIIHNYPGDICSLCGSPIVSVIVPPTMYKSFEKFPKLGLLWSLAYRELHTAVNIVIWGVSFAASDYYLRWLFKKAVMGGEKPPVIFDIDKDESVKEKIKEITGIEPTYCNNLDEFLKRSSKSIK